MLAPVERPRPVGYGVGLTLPIPAVVPGIVPGMVLSVQDVDRAGDDQADGAQGHR